MQIEMEQRHSNILFLSSIMYVYKKKHQTNIHSTMWKLSNSFVVYACHIKWSREVSFLHSIIYILSLLLFTYYI